MSLRQRFAKWRHNHFSGTQGSKRENIIWSDDVVKTAGSWPAHRTYLKHCDAAYENLSLVTEFNAFTEDAPTVICAARNEERRLPGFITHYQNLGAASIHIIDNNSADRTAEIAASYPGVTLWRTETSHAKFGFGQFWRAALARRYGMGHWILNLDADELLVYPGMENKTLGDLQKFAARSRIKHFYTPMIDVYAGQPRNESNIGSINANLFFDGKTHAGQPPYLRRQSIYGPELTGGPRSRMMSAIGETNSPWISKFALAHWDAKTAYANPHYPYPFKHNAPHRYAALLHLKLLDDFSLKTKCALAEQQHWHEAIEYTHYQAWLDAFPMHKLMSEDISAKYKNPESLIAAGIIDPIPWEKIKT